MHGAGAAPSAASGRADVAHAHAERGARPSTIKGDPTSHLTAGQCEKSYLSTLANLGKEWSGAKKTLTGAALDKRAQEIAVSIGNTITNYVRCLGGIREL